MERVNTPSARARDTSDTTLPAVQDARARSMVTGLRPHLGDRVPPQTMARARVPL